MIAVKKEGMTTAEATREYYDAIEAGNPTHVKLVFDNSPLSDVIFTDDDIDANGGMTLTTYMNPDMDRRFGLIYSTEIAVSIFESTKTNLVNWSNKMTLYMGVEIDGETSWVMVKTFYGEDPKKSYSSNVGIFRYIAHDAAYGLFDGSADEFIESLTFPMTLSQLIVSTYQYCGFDGYRTAFLPALILTNSYTIEKNLFPKGIQLKNVISWIAEAVGGYASVTTTISNGVESKKLQFYNIGNSIIYEPPLHPDQYFSYQMADYTVARIPAYCLIDTNDASNNFSYPSTYDGIPYKIVNNPILNAMSDTDKETILTLIYNADYSKRYTPISTDAIGNWLIEPSDELFLFKENGQTPFATQWIFSRTLTWNGACYDHYESTGNKEQPEMTEYEIEQYKQSGKYSVVSNVKITEEGVEISGGAYLKLISGGVLDVQSANFSINSDDMEMICGNNYFDQYGYRFEYADEDHPEQDYKFHIGQNITLPDDTNHSELTAGGVAIDVNGSNVFMPSFNFGFYSDYFFSTHRMYALVSADDRIMITSADADDIELTNIYKITASSYAGTGVANNLTTTTEGKVLDARQGKALNDKFANYKPTQTAKSDPTASGTSITFIDTISQDAKGVITATKKTVRSASDSQSGVVTTGTQTFAGQKLFTTFPVMNNGGQNPGISFRATPLSTSNATIQANTSATSDGKYGRTYIAFYEYSPSSDGSSRTSYYERYDLPSVNSARTSNATYSILTTKTMDYVQGVAVTDYFAGYGFVTSNTTTLHLIFQLPKRISRNIQSIASAKLAVRGISGYVDIFTSTGTERCGTSGYTFTADMRTPFSIEMYIAKTSAMTNITNNTPVTVVGNLTFIP